MVFESSNATSRLLYYVTDAWTFFHTSKFYFHTPFHNSTFTLQNSQKILANWIVPEHFKWRSLLQIQQSVMFLLSTTTIFRCKRWFTTCFTCKFALALSNRIIGVKKMVLYWGHLLPMKVLSFNSLSEISLEV